MTRSPTPDVADKGVVCTHLRDLDQPLLHGMELTAASNDARPAIRCSGGGCGCGIYCQDIGGGRCRYERATPQRDLKLDLFERRLGHLARLTPQALKALKTSRLG